MTAICPIDWVVFCLCFPKDMCCHLWASPGFWFCHDQITCMLLMPMPKKARSLHLFVCNWWNDNWWNVLIFPFSLMLSIICTMQCAITDSHKSRQILCPKLLDFALLPPNCFTSSMDETQKMANAKNSNDKQHANFVSEWVNHKLCCTIHLLSLFGCFKNLVRVHTSKTTQPQLLWLNGSWHLCGSHCFCFAKPRKLWQSQIASDCLSVLAWSHGNSIGVMWHCTIALFVKVLLQMTFLCAIFWDSQSLHTFATQYTI